MKHFFSLSLCIFIASSIHATEINHKQDDQDTKDFVFLSFDQVKKLKPHEKVLLICSNLSKVLNLQSTLPLITRIPFTTFHEDLPLNLRDKNAADFSRDGGVRLLISSEIGSEGRNFQFSHKLILFDLPLNPELLEQRIGRLHRIGQKKTIEI